MSKVKEAEKKAAPVSSVEITDCCCGVVHRMKRAAWEKYRREIFGKADTIPVGNGVVGCWHVPRIFIACHGIKAGELRQLADQYDWEQVTL